MTEYYYQTIDGKRCFLNTKQVAILTNSLWQAIKTKRIMLTSFPDGLSDDDLDNRNRAHYDYCVYEQGKDDNGQDSVNRYYVDIEDNGGFYRTTPIAISYSTFINALLVWNDTLVIENPLTGEALKTFSIQRGA